MRIEDALPRFRRICADAGLGDSLLVPWEAWKAFKTFMREPVTVAYDGASFQCGPQESQQGAFAAFLRVFSEPGEESDDEELLRAVVAELEFDDLGAGVVRPIELHSHDFASFADFVQHVEGLPQFQLLMNRTPTGSEIYAQEL